MLMRSYKTLNRDGEADTALREAISANPQRRAELETAARALGLSG